ncbi:MAG: copper resistance protein CopC [Candidatus Rokubacteria bacterium]|nr:copper resistance protein CopC [Candidatus Rokubacteria bacterium]
MSRLARLARACALALAVVPVPVAAHSLLLGSTPAPDAVVATPPARLTLRFNNRIEKPLCRVRLIEAGGAARELTPLTGGPADQLAATLPELGAGAYRVEWQVLSTDGHVVTGRFSFAVKR